MSDQIGIVLLFGMVVIGGVLVFSVGMVFLDSIQMQASGEKGKMVMQQFDKDLTTSLTNDDVSDSVYLEEGNYNISEKGTIKIATSNGFTELSHDTVTMGTLQHEDAAGNRFGYQAGGIWRIENGRTKVVSRPDIRYYREEQDGLRYGRIDLSVTSLSGNAGPGENSLEVQNSNETVDLPAANSFVSHVEISVEETPYHDGWYRFMRDQFDAVDVDDTSDIDSSSVTNCDFDADISFDRNVVCHDEDERTVTVVATIDGDNPFAHHVGIEPTIYGGLSVDSIDGGDYDSKLNVSGYDPADPGNVSSDLFTVDDGFDLEDDADIDGYPVANGAIDPASEAAVTPIGYVSDPDFDDYDGYTTNGTDVAHVTDDVILANMSHRFEPVDDISGNIETDALGYLETNGQDVDENHIDESGRYYAEEFDVSSINTSDGDVHIGVKEFESGSLSGLTITGGNNVFLYTTADATIQNVTVPGARAGAFWLYGSDESDITIEDDFAGVIYAPESDLTIEDGAEITGAVIGGDADIGEDVKIDFDRSLRTDVPIPEENRDIAIKAARAPLDVTFVLDGSGSMGRARTVTGDDWQDPPNTGPSYYTWTVDPDASHSLEERECRGHRGRGRCHIGDTIAPGETFYPYTVDELRIKDGTDSSSVNLTNGNDPYKLRADATRDFIDLLNESNDDHAGVYEFDSYAREIHPLSGDLTDVKNSVSVTANGNTDITSGIERALWEYDGPPDDGRDRIMVLLGDGENTVGSDWETRQAAEDAADDGVTIYTIGLGSDFNDELLRDVADETGGEYHHVENADELEDKFKGIANRVTEEEEVTFNVGDIPEPPETSSDYVINFDEQRVTIER